MLHFHDRTIGNNAITAAVHELLDHPSYISFEILDVYFTIKDISFLQ